MLSTWGFWRHLELADVCYPFNFKHLATVFNGDTGKLHRKSGETGVTLYGTSKRLSSFSQALRNTQEGWACQGVRVARKKTYNRSSEWRRVIACVVLGWDQLRTNHLNAVYFIIHWLSQMTHTVQRIQMLERRYANHQLLYELGKKNCRTHTVPCLVEGKYFLRK